MKFSAETTSVHAPVSRELLTMRRIAGRHPPRRSMNTAASVDLAKVPRVRLLAQLRYDLLEPIEHADRRRGPDLASSGWPATGPRGRLAAAGRGSRSTGSHSSARPANPQTSEQQVDGSHEILVRRVELVALCVDRAHQQPVDRVQVAVAVEQHKGGSRDRLQRGAGPALGVPAPRRRAPRCRPGAPPCSRPRTPTRSADGCGRPRSG